MREYITELSKYIIPALMAVYTLCSFACLADKLEKKSSIYVLQDVIMFFMQLLMFTDLALTSTGEKKGNSMEYIFFYVFVQIFLLAAAAMVPVIYEQVNRLLLNNMCMLLGTGL